MKTITKEMVKNFVAPREQRGHKGVFGAVLNVCGSANMAGAAVITAKAVYGSGAGLVISALPEEEKNVIFSCVPEAVVCPLSEKREVKNIEKFLKNKTVDLALIGCGVENFSFIMPLIELFEEKNIPFVLDAGGLAAFAEKGLRKINAPHVLTPHPGEAQRLLGREIYADSLSREASAREIAEATGGVCILKGFNTVITDSKNSFLNEVNTSALSKAGTGDALAGIIAGLWAQAGKKTDFKDTALASAISGVWLHAVAAQKAAWDKTEYCVSACGVIDYLPAAIRETLYS